MAASSFEVALVYGKHQGHSQDQSQAKHPCPCSAPDMWRPRMFFLMCILNPKQAGTSEEKGSTAVTLTCNLATFKICGP